MQPLCVMVDDEGDIEAFKDYQPPAGTTPTPAAQPKSDTPAPEASAPPPPSPAAVPIPPAPAAVPIPPAPAAPPIGGMAGRILASPYAKNVASAQGVDLTVSLFQVLIGQLLICLYVVVLD